MTINHNLKGVLLALLSYAAYTCMDGSVKYLVSSHALSWQVLIFYISLTVLFLLFLCINIARLPFRPSKPGWLAFRAIVGVSSLHIIFFILPLVNLNLFYSLVFVAPIIASVLASIFLKEHINIHKLISIVLGFVGILIITQPWQYFVHTQNHHLSLLELVPLLVALGDSIIGITVRKYLSRDHAITLVFYQFILCAMVSGTFAYVSSGGYIPILPLSLLLPIIITSIFTVLGYVCYSMAVQTAQIQVVMPMGYSQMVFGAILSIIVFNEYPNLHTVLGALVIVAASSYLLFYAGTHKKV